MSTTTVGKDAQWSFCGDRTPASGVVLATAWIWLDHDVEGRALWTPPATHEVVSGNRVISYCLYGPSDGFPVIAHGGSPSTRWRRTDVIESIERCAVRVLAFDRPGYPGSTRQVGRRICDIAHDVELLADANGWRQFAVFGYSGGGPYALACAAVLADRVSRCAVGAAVAPPDADGVDFFGRRDARRGKAFRLALVGEAELRPYLAHVAEAVMVGVEAGGPEMLPEPHTPRRGEQPTAQPPRALEDAAAMARLKATFVDSHDGWVDDQIAVAHPWGFDPRTITTPVGVWHGRHDVRIPEDHTSWLVANIPNAQRYDHDGGHLPSDRVYRDMFTWLSR